MAQGGLYEVIHASELHLLGKLDYANSLLKPHLKKDVFTLQNEKILEFGLNPKIVKALVRVDFCGTLDSGFILKSQIRYFSMLGGTYFSNCEYHAHSKKIIDLSENFSHTTQKKIPKSHSDLYPKSKKLETRTRVTVNQTPRNDQTTFLYCRKLIFATNSFTKLHFPKEDISPGRGQILLTQPIANLKIRHSFAFEYGYFYFRNFGPDRILIGGGRNLDFRGEETFQMKTTQKIISAILAKLEEILGRNPGEIKIEKQWAGVMAFAKNKNCYKEVLIRKLAGGVYIAARLGGMGLTFSPFVGEKVASLVLQDLRIKPRL